MMSDLDMKGWHVDPDCEVCKPAGSSLQATLGNYFLETVAARCLKLSDIGSVRSQGVMTTRISPPNLSRSIENGVHSRRHRTELRE